MDIFENHKKVFFPLRKKKLNSINILISNVVNMLNRVLFTFYNLFLNLTSFFFFFFFFLLCHQNTPFLFFFPFNNTWCDVGKYDKIKRWANPDNYIIILLYWIINNLWYPPFSIQIQHKQLLSKNSWNLEQTISQMDSNSLWPWAL